MIPGSVNSLLLSSAATGYQISRSLRFNSADSAYLSRTFTTPTTQGTFTFAAWIKRAELGTTQNLFGVSTNHSLGFTSGNALNLTFAGSSALTTTALFRDPSAWYHIVWTQSGTSHTLYVNNVSVGTATATSSVFNTAVAHQIGAANTANYFNGYLADIHFIDGQALTPSSFTTTDANSNLQPIAYTGSYGTNGFRLPFSDNSGVTATTLGKDSAGSNNWTPTNFSVSSGAGNDSLVDTPTSYGTDTGAGGEVRGNYATLNPLRAAGSHTLSNGNLDLVMGSDSTSKTTFATFGVSSGKWYWEATATTVANTYYPGFGIDTNNALLPTAQSGDTATGYQYLINGQKFNSGSLSSYGASYTNGDVIGIALDMDAGTLTFYKNGSSQGQAFSGISGTATPCTIGYSVGTNQAVSFNFGQRPFAYTAPSGFKALCDTNLPAPTIAQGSTAMDVLTWTGNSASSRALTGLGFSPDFVWIKDRSANVNHVLFDAVRGAGGSKVLFSNRTTAEGGGAGEEGTNYGAITSFDSSGFTVAPGAVNSIWVNQSSDAYAAWCWDAGSTTVTNNSGSITGVQVRANASAGFSIVTYTGTGSNATVGHGLGVAPSMLIVKKRSSAGSWEVYFKDLGASYYLELEKTNAKGGPYSGLWNDTAPTSTVFSIGNDVGVNTNGSTYVCYAFAPVAGYSSFGSYVGNGSADGPFVYTGHRSRFVLIKRTDVADNWVILDTARNTYNSLGEYLLPNTADSGASTTLLDINSNGFKVRFNGTTLNASSGTYIYAAFAESPFQYARAR